MNNYSVFVNEKRIYINKEDCIKVLYDIQKLLFLGYFDYVQDVNEYSNIKIKEIKKILKEEIKKSLLINKDKDYSEEEVIDKSEMLTNEFLIELSRIKDILRTDIEALYNGDPASKDYNEIIVCYPGLFAIMVYRISHILYDLKVMYIPRIMSEYAHSKTGIDIHPGAKIGTHFFIDHGTGIVIGETTIIGNNVKLYQGVTLGALSLKNAIELKGVRRHPEIKDNVTIYSGASILGGKTVIGENCVIGSNVFITSSVSQNKTIKSTKTNVE